MIMQLDLFQTEQNAELLKCAEVLSAKCESFKYLSEEKRRFVIAWAVRSENDSVADIAYRLGISRGKIYRFRNAPDVLKVLTTAYRVLP